MQRHHGGCEDRGQRVWLVLDLEVEDPDALNKAGLRTGDESAGCSVPRMGDGPSLDRVDRASVVLAHPAAIAAFVALLSGWGIVHQARSMLFNGVGVQDGGGFAVIVLVETGVFLSAVSVALS